MKTITRYLGATLVTYILLVLLFLLGLLLFIEFMREFPRLGTGNYNLPQLLSYVALMVPSNLYLFFPMAGLLGCMLGLGLLASHHELIIMRVSGVALTDLMKALAKISGVLIFVALLVGEVVAPWAQRVAVTMRTAALSKGQAALTPHGIWLRSGTDFLHIDSTKGNQELQGITRYEFDPNHQLTAASYASVGSYVNGKWVFKQVVRTTLTQDRTQTTVLAQQVWDLNLNPQFLGIAHIDPDQKSLKELFAYIQYRKQSGLAVQDYQFIFWQRLLGPVANLVMILLALPFVFGPLRGTSTGLRMVVGIVAGFAFYMVNKFAGPLSVIYQVPPLLAALLPVLCMGLLGTFLLRKVR